jgi:hypothetical protein
MMLKTNEGNTKEETEDTASIFLEEKNGWTCIRKENGM